MLYRDDTLSSRRITYVLSPLPEVAAGVLVVPLCGGVVGGNESDVTVQRSGWWVGVWCVDIITSLYIFLPALTIGINHERTHSMISCF